MKRLLAEETLGYKDALKYFSKETIDKAVEEASSYVLQDDSIFDCLANDKNPDDITMEDMINYACVYDNLDGDIVDALISIGQVDFQKAEDYDLAYERATNHIYNAMDVFKGAIKANPNLKKKMEADLEVSRSEYEHKHSGSRDGAMDADDLAHNDDKVGDTIELSKSFDVDLGNRDTPFIYLRGEIITGDKRDTHSDLINKYFKNNKLMRKRIRSIDSVDDLEAGEPVAFGHIAQSMAFIQTVENCTMDEVKNALQKSGSYKKIYDYEFENSYVTRLAKRIK